MLSLDAFDATALADDVALASVHCAKVKQGLERKGAVIGHPDEKRSELDRAWQVARTHWLQDSTVRTAWSGHGGINGRLNA